MLVNLTDDEIEYLTKKILESLKYDPAAQAWIIYGTTDLEKALHNAANVTELRKLRARISQLENMVRHELDTPPL